MQTTERCTLCGCGGCPQICVKKDATYFRCPECNLVFMAGACRPGADEEMERYLQHNNRADDEGYIRHLMDIGERVVSRVEPGLKGLDYGSGPAPVMAELLRKRGFECEVYDPLFAPERSALQRCYDFVVCCEVAEHFHNPLIDFLKMYNLLHEGGLLGLKTSLLSDGIELASWYYANDPTHVSFYSDETFDWITNRFGLKVEDRDAGRIVWRKGPVNEPVTVTAGIIRDKGRVLIAARNSGDLAGKWEFPGGKLKDGESPGRGLIRELEEELGVNSRVGRELARIKVPGNGGWLDLCFMETEIDEEPASLSSHSEWMWVTPSDLKDLPMPAGDSAFFDIWMQY